jgi:phytoene desaturase
MTIAALRRPQGRPARPASPDAASPDAAAPDPAVPDPAAPRVAIIGAGPGGLAAALLLAAEGVRVTLFERDAQVGGRTRTITAPGGFRFDLGPTFFLYPRVLAEIFQACGVRLEDRVELLRLDPQYHLVFESGGEMLASGDVARLEAAVARLCPADAPGVRRWLAENRVKLDAFRPVLERPFMRLTDYLTPSMLAALPHMRPHRSVDADLRRYFSDPRVRLAFSFQAKYLGMSPFRCPSLFTILSFLEYEHGVYHPVGGCGAVTAAMADLASETGVEIRTSCPVDSVEWAGERVRAVFAGGRRHPTDAVVVNGDFGATVPGLVPERLRKRWTDRRLSDARLSCSTLMLYLGIDGPVPGLHHHTILLSRDYERNLQEIDDGCLPTEPSIYVQNAGASDPSMHPPGQSSLYVLVPVPNRRSGIEWSRELPAYRRRVLDRLGLIGLGDLEPRIRYERVVTPDDWQADHGIWEGATFNLSHDLGQMLYFRPHNRFVPGAVYLVGGGTHPGSGLPVIFEGARITARLLLEDLGVKASHPVLRAAE